MSDETKTYEVGSIISLPAPVKWKQEGEEVEISEVKIEREPTLEDVESVNFSQMVTGDFMRIFGRMIAMPKSFMSRMPLKNATVVIEVVGSFLDDGRATEIN